MGEGSTHWQRSMEPEGSEEVGTGQSGVKLGDIAPIQCLHGRSPDYLSSSGSQKSAASGVSVNRSLVKGHFVFYVQS